jgi:hypothetical protein
MYLHAHYDGNQHRGNENDEPGRPGTHGYFNYLECKDAMIHPATASGMVKTGLNRMQEHQQLFNPG